MHIRTLSKATKKLAEAVRPAHVRAVAGQQDALPADIAHTAANLIESALDTCLSKRTVTDKIMQKWQEGDTFHAKIFLRWTMLNNSSCSVRLGLDWPIVYLPSDLIGEVRKMIVQFYQEEGWVVQITDGYTLLSHEGAPNS